MPELPEVESARRVLADGALHRRIADVDDHDDYVTRPLTPGALRSALIEGLGLKPRLAFGPVRVAVTGKKISPPLFESLELLGRTSALARIEAARAGLPQD